jgi:NifB/MoaA-like Fe-S oxidoreductase
MFDRDDCAKVVTQVEFHQQNMLMEYGTRLVYLADEFYIKAGRSLPPCEAYEDFPQIENGVGLMALLMDEVILEREYPEDYEGRTPSPKSIATSYIAYDHICYFVDLIKEIHPEIQCNIYKIRNDFFGENITVTGLLCGRDIIEQLKDKELGEYLMLSSSMFKDDCDIFLDDTTKEEVEQALNVKIIKTENSGADFVAALMK